MNNFKKSLLSALSLFSFLSMTSHSAFSLPMDNKEDESESHSRGSTSPRQNSPRPTQDSDMPMPPAGTLQRLACALEESKRLFETIQNDIGFSHSEIPEEAVEQTRRMGEKLQLISNVLNDLLSRGEDNITSDEKKNSLYILINEMDSFNLSMRGFNFSLFEPEENTSPAASFDLKDLSEKTFEELMSIPEGRVFLRREAFEFAKALLNEEQNLSDTDEELSGCEADLSGSDEDEENESDSSSLFQEETDYDGMTFALEIIENALGSDDWDLEESYSDEGWLKTHILELIQDIKNALNGPIKAKYTPSNKN